MPHYLRQHCLGARIGRKSIRLSSTSPASSSPSFATPSLPSCKVSALDRVEASAQHHGLSVQAHCSSVSASSSLSTLSASAKPPHPNINKNANNQIGPQWLGFHLLVFMRFCFFFCILHRKVVMETPKCIKIFLKVFLLEMVPDSGKRGNCANLAKKLLHCKHWSHVTDVYANGVFLVSP